MYDIYISYTIYIIYVICIYMYICTTPPGTPKTTPVFGNNAAMNPLTLRSFGVKI